MLIENPFYMTLQFLNGFIEKINALKLKTPRCFILICNKQPLQLL